MITMAADCLLFELAGGESVPFSADMITVELVGKGAGLWEADFVRHAAQAVFHYFKQEMGRQTVTVGEFTGALEKVLRGLNLRQDTMCVGQGDRGGGGTDLVGLARDAGVGGELSFFPRLRQELRRQIERSPSQLRFHSLRGCVKLLVGTRRWSGQCRNLEEHIIAYLRLCLRADAPRQDCAMLVE